VGGAEAEADAQIHTADSVCTPLHAFFGCARHPSKSLYTQKTFLDARVAAEQRVISFSGYFMAGALS